MQMRLYYIAYDYGPDGLELIDGPYGTRWEALTERDSLSESDEKLIVVYEVKDVVRL